MARGKKRGSRLPLGMLNAENRKGVEGSIRKQRKAIEAQYGGPTKLLPRGHAEFFTSIDASNVHLNDERLTSLSLEDANNICLGDGRRGTNRKNVQLYLRDKIARATKPDEADAKEAKRACLREEGKLDLELADLDDDARKNAWRALLVDPASFELTIPRRKFLERTGGKGDYFYDQLERERRDAAFAKAKASGEGKTSVRQRTRTASSKCGRGSIASTSTPSTQRPLDCVAVVQYSRVDVPTGKTPNLFSEEDYDDDGLEPFGNPDGVKCFWVCNDPAYDYVIGLLLAKMTHGGLVALGTAWILVAWKHELSLEMKLSGLMPDLGRCLTVAAETTRVHVMMARFRVQDLQPGAVVAR